MRYYLFILSFLCVSLASHGQRSDSLLFDAYKTQSSEQLKTFFSNWVSETPSISDSAFKNLNDTLKNVYQVYQCFYTPTDLLRIGGSEWGKDIYAKVSYLLVQDKISYGFTSMLDKDSLLQRGLRSYVQGDTAKLRALLEKYKNDKERLERNWLDFPAPQNIVTLNHFRPKLAMDTPQAVVLTPAYDSLLNAFLGNKHYKMGAGNIMSPARPKGESGQRQAFLENYLKIWYGHWDGYWQLISYPYVRAITFDKGFKHAVINYRMVYEVGYAYLKKIDGAWKLIEARRTWIE